MAAGNPSFTRLITTTLQNHGKEIFDAVSTNNPLYYYLKQKGNIKVVGGGRKFTHPIYYKQNSSFRAYSKLETISTPNMDDISRAEYDIRTIAGSLVLPIFDMAANAGNREQLIKLGNEIRMGAEISMSEVLGDNAFADGTNVKEFGGLRFLINDSPSTQTDVGGINPSTTGNEYWQNDTYTIAVTAFNTDNAGITAMDDVSLNTTYGRQGAKAIFTTKAIWSLYSLSMTPNIRYAQTSLNTGDKAFKNLVYATMPVHFDDNCPDYHMYFVDTDSLWLQVLSRGNMVTTDFEQSHNQLSKIALMYCFANLTAGSRRTQGVITNITA
jgi:hypothetical protein